tara:strand:- start:33 stop:272 length:240 start_codon:yes stop_codon:yes gene_type:complete
MKICKRQYRIVTDSFGGFEVQKRLWYYPFWFQIKNKDGYMINTHHTIEQAENLIEIDKTNSREIDNKPKRRVVKTFNCG